MEMNVQLDKCRLISLMKNVEEKFSRMKLIHTKLFQLIDLLEETHENLSQQFIQMKRIVDCKIDDSPSSFNSSSTNSLNNDNRPNSSTSELSSNLKKSNQLSTTHKSVTFQLEEDKSSNQMIEQNPRKNVISNLFEEHHEEVTKKSNIEFELGNALTNVRIHEIEPINGEYLRLFNVSNSDDYDLTGHFIQQNVSCVPISRFQFPPNTIIRAGQTITIYCGSSKEIESQPPYVFLWKERRHWETSSECVTILAKPTGQAIAWARNSNPFHSDQSSSDILFVHSKWNVGINDQRRNVTPNSFNSQSRLSGLNSIVNRKSPFAHSPSNPIHDYPRQRSGISHLLNRPKSSPFSSHCGSKEDSISRNLLTKSMTNPKNYSKTHLN